MSCIWSRPCSSVLSTIRAIVCTVTTGYCADAGLARQHHRVGPVEDRVRHVGRLGAGRPRGGDHRLEHLGRHDHRLRPAPGRGDDPLLDQRHLFERQLDSEIAAGDHEAVERVDDLVEIVHRLRLLDLGDDRDPATHLVHDLVDEIGVARAADERQARPCRRPACSAQRRSSMSFSLMAGTLTATPGRLMPLLLLTSPPTTTRVTTSVLGHLGRLQQQPAVVDQDRVAGLDVAGQTLVGRRAAFDRAGDSSVVIVKLAPFSSTSLPAAKRPSRIFGPCRSASTPTARPVAAAAARDVVEVLLVIGVVPVTHVQSGDIHPRRHEFDQSLRRRGRGSQRAHDLCSTHTWHPSEVGGIDRHRRIGPPPTEPPTTGPGAADQRTSSTTSSACCRSAGYGE